MNKFDKSQAYQGSHSDYETQTTSWTEDQEAQRLLQIQWAVGDECKRVLDCGRTLKCCFLENYNICSNDCTRQHEGYACSDSS